MDVKGKFNILVSRPDRIGDVVLSTPVFEVLRKQYPQAEITVLVRSNVAPLLLGSPFVDHVLIFDPDGRHAGSRGLFHLIEDFSGKKFRVGIALQSHWKVAAAMFAAGIRYRVGPISKPHSYFFYNRGIRQRRSQVEMHETDYNLALLRRLGIKVQSRSVQTRVALSETSQNEAEKWLKSKGLLGVEGARSMVVVHPGMGGSALNWPEEHWLELCRELLREGNPVLVTGGPAEKAILEKIENGVRDLEGKIAFYGGGDARGVDFLAGLFFWAGLIIAPSTGPLHIAVALGKPVVSFFPPIRVQSAIRWGPYTLDENQASVLVPEIYCGRDFTCRGPVCNYYPCMKSLTVTQALEQIHLILAKSQKASPHQEQK